MVGIVVKLETQKVAIKNSKVIETNITGFNSSVKSRVSSADAISFGGSTK